jgi:hypothetical protein
MQSYRKSRARSVEAQGAAAGSVVHGAGANNQGLRIRVLCEQSRGTAVPSGAPLSFSTSATTRTQTRFTPCWAGRRTPLRSSG